MATIEGRRMLKCVYGKPAMYQEGPECEIIDADKTELDRQGRFESAHEVLLFVQMFKPLDV